MKYSHPLWRTLRSIKGNQRTCVVMEPLWAIPYYLFLPFTSIYMAAVGLQDKQIGMLASLGLAFQFIWGLFSGAITDKYGRRRTMLIFGLVSWSIPCVLWAAAHGYSYFLIAVFFNSMWQVTGNCFSCMIVEDGETEKLVNIYTILNLTGMLAGFISPLAGFFIDRFTLVPTMRVIYSLSMLLMTIKFILQYKMSNESVIGMSRVKSCKSKSIFSLTFGSWGVISHLLLRPRLFSCVLFMTLLACFNTIQSTFWPLFITSAFGVSAALLSIIPLVTSIASILAYTLIVPRVKLHSIKLPLLAGLGLHVLNLGTLLICLNVGVCKLWVVFLSAISEALGLALLGPLCESIMSIVIPSGERASINSYIFALIMIFSTPSGWIAGYLSQINRELPMILNLCIILAVISVSLPVLRVFKSEERRN